MKTKKYQVITWLSKGKRTLGGVSQTLTVDADALRANLIRYGIDWVYNASVEEFMNFNFINGLEAELVSSDDSDYYRVKFHGSDWLKMEPAEVYSLISAVEVREVQP